MVLYTIYLLFLSSNNLPNLLISLQGTCGPTHGPPSKMEQEEIIAYEHTSHSSTIKALEYHATQTSILMNMTMKLASKSPN